MVSCLSELWLFTRPRGIVPLGFEGHDGMIGVLCFKQSVNLGETFECPFVKTRSPRDVAINCVQVSRLALTGQAKDIMTNI